MPAIVHVTHEAVTKVGGIGAVLAGLLTSQTYLQAFERNVLVSAYWPGDDHDGLLGAGGQVLYSSIDSICDTPHAAALAGVETAFGVQVIYGRRHFHDPGTGITSDPEILLIDVRNIAAGPLGVMKFRLWQKFGLESAPYDHIYDFEQWVRLAAPAIAALRAIGVGDSPSRPAVIFAHEYMGLPTALAGKIEPNSNFKAIFHAHEVATMRRIVEHAPGHDTMFYNVLRLAPAEGKYVDDVFGSQDDYYKHAVIRCVRFCDNVFCVGDDVLREFRFMGEAFKNVPMQLAYNGIPSWKITPSEKTISRDRLRQYAENLLGWRPDFVFSHVTRLVLSKGLWRDLGVLAKLEPLLRARNETAVMFVLSTEVPARRPADIRAMEQTHDWPIAHREGGTDLSHGEAIYYAGVQAFNERSRNIKVIFINQFGFTRKVCGEGMPAEMTWLDIRRGTDVEFGQSIYEPFGIAQIEPLGFGGVCVFSGVCGCAGFVDKIRGNKPTPNLIIADYTRVPPHLATHVATARAIGRGERDAVEAAIAADVAIQLNQRLPRTAKTFESLIERGHELSDQMSWDAVAKRYIVPGIARAMGDQ